jgi:hypothetical protein
MEDAQFDDLDRDLILATLADYNKRLGLPVVTNESLLPLLREQGLIVMKGSQPIPTIGAFLLFGKNTSERFPHAKISFTRGGKKRKVFDGNLINQFRRLLEYLNTDEINPLLRLKGNRTAETQPAYADRAIVELIVNTLVHRDYEIPEHAAVEFEPGRFLRFSNPGGLPADVHARVVVGPEGTFSPVRGLTVLRNPRLGDIFFGIGSMDKAGSGLPDADRLMQELGGKAEFRIGSQNGSVHVTLFQAVQSSPETSSVATPLVPSETFTTNMLPFSVLPEKLSVLPLRSKPLPDMPLFEPEEDPRELPIFIIHDEKLLTFANLKQFPQFADKRGFLGKAETIPLRAFLEDENNRRLFVWLVGKHWEFFLARFWESGLRLDRKKKRAYFTLVAGEGNTIKYDSTYRKNVKREVVKKRLRGKKIEFENEGITHAIVEFVGQWAVRIKPFYVFTKVDGRSPLPAFLQGRRSTSRIKFDRNKSVGDDLIFWSRFLSIGQPTMNIGGLGVSDLIVSSEFCSVDAQETKKEVDV